MNILELNQDTVDRYTELLQEINILLQHNEESLAENKLQDFYARVEDEIGKDITNVGIIVEDSTNEVIGFTLHHNGTVDTYYKSGYQQQENG